MNNRNDLKKQADDCWRRGKLKERQADSLFEVSESLRHEANTFLGDAKKIYNKIESPQFKTVE